VPSFLFMRLFGCLCLVVGLPMMGMKCNAHDGDDVKCP
jgi:hypothetical protein